MADQLWLMTCIREEDVYVPAWIACPVASDAPVNDLMLFRRIKQYAEINKVVSQAALNKLLNHTWYLGSKMVRTEQGHCGACRRKWRLTHLQTLICVLVARLGRCPTLSNPVLWQS